MRGVALALAVPVVFVLIVRFIMSFVLQSDNRNADSLLKGIIQGILMYHATISTHRAISIALFFGFGGRLLGDFVLRGDNWKLASTLLGIAFGVLMADVVSYLYDDMEWTTIHYLDDFWVFRSEKRHSHRSKRRVSDPRRIEELPAVYEELSSIDSRSRLSEIDDELSDAEKEVARLRAKALHAAGQRRRYREERKWAVSQGNLARALQLRWQVKKYHALAESFTREADQKLLEADRAKRKPSSPPSSQGERYYVPDHEPMPFVQVVVEGGGSHEREAMVSDSAEDHSESRQVGTKIVSRVTKDLTKLKSGIHIDSRGVLTRSGRTSNTSISMGSSEQSPPTSDTWSRQLD